MKKVLLYFSLVIGVLTLRAQPVEEDYHAEVTWGVNKNTNGGLIGGIMFKIGKEIDRNKYVVYGFELVNVKHPLEIRRLSSFNGQGYIFGKRNYLYSIRGQYGREYLLYKKAPQQGVQVSGIVSGGPTIGIIAPYYVIYNGNYEQFDPSIHNNLNAFQGSGRIFQGIGQSDITFGLNAKAGMLFEFGSFKSNVVGLELGVSAEAFPKKIVIVPDQDNKAVFTALYVNMYWGTRR